MPLVTHTSWTPSHISLTRDMNARLTFSLLVALVSLVGCQTGNETIQSAFDPGEVQGEWRGTATQRGYGEYPVEMTIDNLERGEVSGTTNYPTLSCGGNLIYEGRGTNTHIFTERIENRSGGNCIDNGRVEVRGSANGRLMWEWYQSGEQDNATATATLQR